MKSVFLPFLLFIYFNSAFSQENAEFVINDLLNKSMAFTDNRQLDSASFYLERAIAIRVKQSIDSTLYYKESVAKAAIFMRKGDTQKAHEILLSSLAFFKNINDSNNIALAYYQIGICNYLLNRRLVSLEYFEKANNLNKFLSGRVQTKILQNLGTINLEEGMAQKDSSLFYKAIHNYEQVAKIFIAKNQLTELSLCTSLWAECYIQLNQLNTAYKKANEAIKYAKQSKNDQYLGFALIKKNSILTKQQKLKEALEIIDQAIAIYEKSKDNASLSYAYVKKKKTLLALNRYKETTEVQEKIYGLTIQMYNKRIADGVTEMEAKYKTAEKEKEIAEQNLRIKNKNIFSLVLGGSIIILTIILIGLYKRHQLKQKQFQKEMSLKDALTKIKTQNKLQEQRLEISRDLHDNIGSQLTFIISSIDNLKMLSSDSSKLVKEKLSTISSFTIETIDQLRDTIWAMNKNKVTFEDLHGRLLSFVEKAKKIAHHIDFEITEKSMNSYTFSSVVGMNLFRVIQEAINNALKHSSASKISIQFKQSKSEILITIEDNGKGFDKNNFVAGNGLSNIENRVSAIHGEVVLKSDLGKGTQIQVSIDKSHL